ncbi:hypothetical protein [Leifsonia naganoensis]|uniref:Drug/metabolite transporter (DMT)-like permease n=1 Tax=Leifsonia naganoensis TaxID=150025 RepID=A0A853DV31_9MICO|nr:hypothetical protein [Leifsonia naganoensis]NYK09675.1 drug/metabolite transporter (DMT)-like permease [Leifsonia naganoensis]
MTEALRARARWNPAVVVLLVLGVALAAGGATRALMAKFSIDHPAPLDLTIRPLPVFVYTQYTQRLPPPDYAGLWMGVTVAVIGAAVVAVGIVVARRGSLRHPGH